MAQTALDVAVGLQVFSKTRVFVSQVLAETPNLDKIGDQRNYYLYQHRMLTVCAKIEVDFTEPVRTLYMTISFTFVKKPPSMYSRLGFMSCWNWKLLLRHTSALVLLTAFVGSGLAQVATNRYALILNDPAPASKFETREATQSAEARSYQRQVEAAQRTLRNELQSRNIEVAGSVSTILNAVFVVVPSERVPELKSLPGVKGVVPLRRRHVDLNRATQIVNAPVAWTALGGMQNAGAGVKIGILDTGIELTHPAFKDSSLPMPAGYPICNGSDCAFTSNKIIVARSYVRQLAAGSAGNPAADSRPDDYSPRDRSGHGTAVASCAAGVLNTGAVTFSGMAPKAYLGSYKIYGSPEVNDFTADDVIIQALEDAFNDGMDIVSFSTGGPALSGPLDSGATCQNAPGVPCDLVAQTFETVANKGVVIVTAAGNDGQSGVNVPTYNTISSPGDVPSVISVGASTNSHSFRSGISVQGAGVPSSLQSVAAELGDGPVPSGPVTAPLLDVAQAGNDGYACSALPSGALSGDIALIERGPVGSACSFSTKLGNAQDAGAVGVVFYNYDATAAFGPGGLSSYNIPAVMISNTDGVALKNFADANPGHAVTLDASQIEQSATGNQLAFFSSLGPTTGDGSIKPDLVAPGTNIYMAAETFDPLGDLYSANGYAVADGTSFATPIVSGAAALVKQKHPTFTAAQIKSALVNTASQSVVTDDSGNPVSVQSLGGGLLDAGAAVNDSVTSIPSTLPLGVLTSGSLPRTQQLRITNGGAAAVNLTAAIATGKVSSGATLALDKQSLALAPGASGTIAVTLSGSVPTPGPYYGAVTLQGSGVSLRVPYLYLVGDGVAANIIPLVGDQFDGTVGEQIPDGIIAFKLIDRYGVAVANSAVTFTARNGGSIQNADTQTDVNGIAAAEVILGAQPGSYSFTAVAGRQRWTFTGTARAKPNIPPSSIVNAASFDVTSPVAPGSYISIFGTGLADGTHANTYASLPLALDFVLVSFDVPSTNISVPGRLIYVSPTQVNVQVPWELQGQTSAQVKVTIDFSHGNVVSLPLSDFAPALFEASAGAVAALDAGNKTINASNPARRGQTIELFANGLGPVNNQPATGEPASGSGATTKSTPSVTIGGQQAAVSFSGLAPGFAGLYQVNATVPSGLSAGNQQVTISIGGKTSKVSQVLVQ